MTSFQLTSPIDPSDSVFHPPVPPWSQCYIAVCGRRSNMWWTLLACKMVLTGAKLGQQARIFDGNSNFDPFDQSDFSETLFYDVRFDLPEAIIRNRRDSSFYPGNQPAGVKGITKGLLEFIRHRVNPMGLEVGQERDKFGEEYEVDNYIHDEYF